MSRGSVGRRLVAVGIVLQLGGCYGPEEPVRPIPTYIVTFEGQATALDVAGIAIVEAAAATARAAPDRRLLVAGYAASRVGTPQATQIQTRLRAQAVADGLLARGVGKDRIKIRLKTAVGADPGAESRRVEIVIGH